MRYAYAANILILLPVLAAVLRGSRPGSDQGRFAESEGWRLLAGSLWTGILVLSVFGLFRPFAAAPVLVLQVVYKTLWLLLYAAPRARAGRWSEIPPGIAVSFAVIVLVWPWLIPWTALGAR